MKLIIANMYFLQLAELGFIPNNAHPRYACWEHITWGWLRNDLSILGSLPRGLLRLRMGIVGPTISRPVFKPHLCLTAGRGKGETLLRGGGGEQVKNIIQ